MGNPQKCGTRKGEAEMKGGLCNLQEVGLGRFKKMTDVRLPARHTGDKKF